MDSEWISIPIRRIIHATAKAFLVDFGDIHVWVPKSQVQDPHRYSRGYSGPLLPISAWWIEVNDMEDYANPPWSNLQGATPPPPPIKFELITADRIYRRLAAKYHPDRSPDTAEFMKDINELWQGVLRDMRGSKNGKH